MAKENEKCCQLIKREEWDEKELVWRSKPFYRTKYKEFMHMPLNYGSVLRKARAKISESGLSTEAFALSGEESVFSSSLLVPVSEKRAGLPIELVNGTFLTKVFEGNYSEIKSWIQEMTNYVHGKDKEAAKLWFWYPVCPKCAKEYKKIQTVIFAALK
ncbi:MAG: hydrolase [Patescibacteria group bacterium]